MRARLGVETTVVGERRVHDRQRDLPEVRDAARVEVVEAKGVARPAAEPLVLGEPERAVDADAPCRQRTRRRGVGPRSAPGGSRSPMP